MNHKNTHSKYLETIISLLGKASYRHPLIVISTTVVLTILAWQGVKRIRIDTDLRALLPAKHQTVQRLETVRDNIGGQSFFLVEIRSPDRQANIRFGEKLAAKMRKMSNFRFVIFHREVEFLKRHALLFLPIKDLLDLRDDVISSIKKEVAKHVAVQLDDETNDDEQAQKSKKEITSSKLDKDPDELIRKGLGGAVMPGEYLEADDGKLLIIKARPIKQTTDVKFSVATTQKVMDVAKSLNPQQFHPKLRFNVVGDYASRAKESKSIGRSVTTTIGFSLGLLVFVIFLFYRRFVAIFIVLIPVVISSIIAMGIGGVIYDAFNLVTTFIFAVLLGLGIDFAIHFLSRYVQERRLGASTDDALGAATAKTGVALFSGAITTAAAFFLLIFADFRGFSQFGVVAGIGVLAALLATYLLTPALLALVERFLPKTFIIAASKSKDSRENVPAFSEKTIGKTRFFSGVIIIVSLGISMIAIYNWQEIPFEYDFNKLGQPKKAKRKQLKKRTNFRNAIGKKTSFGPAVPMCKSVDECEEITRMLHTIQIASKDELASIFHPGQAKSKPLSKNSNENDDEDDDDDELAIDPFESLRASLKGGRLLPKERIRLKKLGEHRLNEMKYFLRAVLSLHTLVPAHQKIKLEIITDIRKRLNAKRSRFSEEIKQKLKKWDKYLAVNQPLKVNDLPRWFSDQLRQIDGKLGYFLVIYNAGAKADYQDAKRLYQSFFTLPTTKRNVSVAANYFVLVDVIDTLRAEGPIIIGMVAAAVFCFVLISFRSLIGSIFVFIPLMVSVGWLAAVFLFANWKVNLFSIVAFPLLVGMGIDNGIHVYHRWLEEKRVFAVLRGVGGPITLTTLTTFIGFAGLLFANHIGIQTLGITAGLGMWLTYLGAVITLPALLYFIHSSRKSNDQGRQ